MQKLIILLLLFFATNCVFLRDTNYDEKLLNECLSENKLSLGDDLKDLLDLYNHGRTFLLEIKLNALHLVGTSQDLIKKCFSTYGIYNQFGDCTLNCHDKCDFYNRGDKDCYRRCPIC